VLDTVLGLPIHPLIVHATVVLVPGAALLVGGAATNRRFRAWLGPVPALAALLACVLVPLSTGSGEELEQRIGESHLVEEHAEIAGTLIWFVVPLAVVAVLGYALHRRGALTKRVAASVAVGAVLLSGATLVDVALIGHSGAKASWSQVGSQPAPSGTSDSD
jgi:uncharacterized membrane protein